VFANTRPHDQNNMWERCTLYIQVVLQMFKLKNNSISIFYYFNKYTCDKMSQCKQVNFGNKC